MFSILIPVYNFDVRELVGTLNHQAQLIGQPYEIIVMDDCSTRFIDENSAIEQLEYCKYIKLPQNLGRSSIRNRLVDVSKYDKLIMMDSDAKVINNSYISNYLNALENSNLIFGGIEIAGEVQTLRKKYEKKNGKRHNFTTFNFAVTKSQFNKVRFDETIKHYGFEDTIFFCEQKNAGAAFMFLDNPLVHLDNDTNEMFVSKTETALTTLSLVMKQDKYTYLSSTIRVARTVTKIRKLRLRALLSLLEKLFRKPLRSYLISTSTPSLLFFDIFKLLTFYKQTKS